MRSRTHRLAVAVGAAVLLLAVLTGASDARAAYDSVGSGVTRLSFDKGFLKLLKQHHVRLSVSAPATLAHGAVDFPVVGGKFDPTTGKGTVEHEGELWLVAGGRRISLRALKLKTTAKRAPLAAKVGGSQLKLATAAGLRTARRGFGDQVRVEHLLLSAKFATRLGKKLRLRGVFRSGQPLARLTTRAQPETTAVVARGRASLTLDPAFEAKLRSLFVAVNPIFPAEHPGAFTLPIFGGNVAPDASAGAVATQGALEFIQLGGGQVFWHEGTVGLDEHALVPEVDVEPSPPYLGKAGPLTVAGFEPRAASSDPSARTVSIAGVLVLGAGTAATFNEVFARPQGKDAVFAAGETLGTLALTAQGQ